MVTTLNPQIRKLIDAFAVGQAHAPTRIGTGAVYFVPSDSELGAFHIVGQVQFTDKGKTRRGWVCSCRAFRFNATGDERCKHIEIVQTGLLTKSPSRSRSKPKTTKRRKAATARSSVATKKAVATGSSSKRTARKSASSRKKSTRKSASPRKPRK